MQNILKTITIACCAIGLLSLAACGGGSGAAPAAVPAAANIVTGIVVNPNLGPTTGSTLTATDLVTNALVGSTSTQNPDGSYTVPTSNTTNPVLIKITGGTYLDEATGVQQPLPNNGLSACLPDPTIAQAALTPLTEIATQAALAAAAAAGATSAPALASLINQANIDVGSALLGGADPTTTFPVDISQATPAGATLAQQNYARVLAGLAVDAAANSGGDLFAAATALATALFDASGKPASAVGGALPVELTRLQTAAQNYTPPAGSTILAGNVPPVDPNAVIGVVNPALSNGNNAQYYYMEVSMDPANPITGQQISEAFVELGFDNPDLATGVSQFGAFAAYTNGMADAVLATGSHGVSTTPLGQLRWNNLTTPGRTPITFEFSNDGEFAVGEDIGDNGSSAVRLDFLVKKPTTAPTLASVAGIYHLVLLGHDSSLAPTAAAGYVESGTLTLDGNGGTSYNAVNTDITTGVPVFSPINGVSTYAVAPNGVILNAATTGNGHLIFSANGQYALYELHGMGTQEWGIAIKDHASTIPFSAMNSGIAYDVHAQGLMMGVDFHKALSVALIAPHPLPQTVPASDSLSTALKSFSPVQLAPTLFCGTAATAACTGSHPQTYGPVVPNTTLAAVNGEFTMTPGVVGIDPALTGYISQDGGVFWIDDGEASAIVIGLGR